jgi:hypothetical protein
MQCSFCSHYTGKSLDLGKDVGKWRWKEEKSSEVFDHDFEYDEEGGGDDGGDSLVKDVKIQFSLHVNSVTSSRLNPSNLHYLYVVIGELTALL